MKEKYIELMEKALSAYSDEHILRYFNDVKANGLTEHGFPRLTANIGILIAHGRRCDLLPIFLEMMEFCCEAIPTVKAANDFSVREIVCCLLEIEQSKVVSKEETDRWRDRLATIEPTSCYNKFATAPTDTVRNWALFSGVSEYFRQQAGLCDSTEFIELQLRQQLQWLDENGMYMDAPEHEQWQPIMYDFVPRGLFSLLLSWGYCGTSADAIDEALKKAGLLTLDMQSPNGEVAFGGRSNQFLHNEAWVMTVLEYEAKRYACEGNDALAARFKAAAAKALANTEQWLNKQPIRHIKNRYPTETKYGCEEYAYFDKYMISVASILYAAYLVCDDAISFASCEDYSACVAQTSPYFHKLFLKAGGYGIEFDLYGDPHYDANGLGRIHRDGAPSVICLSCPCPSDPIYVVDIENPLALSFCSSFYKEGKWQLGAEEGCRYEVTKAESVGQKAYATLLCRFADGQIATEDYTVCEDGVSVTVSGCGELGYALPVFSFDGEICPKVAYTESEITVSYEGWVCRYSTDGKITDLNKVAANRNGHYRAFLAAAKDVLHVKMEIVKA